MGMPGEGGDDKPLRFDLFTGGGELIKFFGRFSFLPDGWSMNLWIHMVIINININIIIM